RRLTLPCSRARHDDGGNKKGWEKRGKELYIYIISICRDLAASDLWTIAAAGLVCNVAQGPVDPAAAAGRQRAIEACAPADRVGRPRAAVVELGGAAPPIVVRPVANFVVCTACNLVVARAWRRSRGASDAA